MTSHELANHLLKHPDLPVAIHANGHTYAWAAHKQSHGPLQIGLMQTYAGQHLAIGNMIDLATTENHHTTEILETGPGRGNP